METKQKTARQKGKIPSSGRSRFTDLVHYICACSGESPEKLGATKLNKALWYVDTISYCKFGKSISGETLYRKQKFGPVPRHIGSALKMLEAEGSIAVTSKERFGYIQKNFVCLKPPNSKAFSKEERELIDEIVRVICDEHTASSISELSHDVIWDAAELGEDIPIHAVLAADRDDITTQDKVWANKVINAITKAKREGTTKRTLKPRTAS
jgi:hypothetical protein